ncbi:MAG: nucleoside deaminase [Tepidisphaeraceae bacterium]
MRLLSFGGEARIFVTRAARFVGCDLHGPIPSSGDRRSEKRTLRGRPADRERAGAGRADHRRGHNRRVQHGDPMAHAEIDCLKNAGRQASYKDTVLYSTLMPCFLCTGAAVQFGVPKVVVGESVTFPGGESKWGRSADFLRAAGIEVIDLHDATCIQMMTDFIKNNPVLWNEDIGV